MDYYFDGPFFVAHLPLQLVQNVADMYLSSEHKSIRLEAVKTCTALLVPALLPPTIFTTPFVQFSQASSQVVADVLRKLLTVGITDTGNSKEIVLFISSEFTLYMYVHVHACYMLRIISIIDECSITVPPQ